MTKRQLIEALEASAAPDDAIVVMSRDSEGNNYSPLRVVDGARYRAETPVRGEVDHPNEPWEVGEGVVEAVVFWPAN